MDWSHVVEEIQAVGTAQLNDARGLLRQAMICLVRLHFDRNDAARPDARLEPGLVLDDAAEQCTPSMRQRIDLDFIWHRVRARVIRDFMDDPRGQALPDRCPWILAALLANDHDGSARLCRMAGRTRLP